MLYEGKKYHRNPDISWRKIEGQAVLIFNKDGIIKVLNKTATFIWENLDEINNLDEISGNISQTFEVERNMASEDTKDFFSQLLSMGAIIEEANGANPATGTGK